MTCVLCSLQDSGKICGTLGRWLSQMAERCRDDTKCLVLPIPLTTARFQHRPDLMRQLELGTAISGATDG